MPQMSPLMWPTLYLTLLHLLALTVITLQKTSPSKTSTSPSNLLISSKPWSW